MAFKQSFQWFMDLQTSTTEMQIIQFSAGGEHVRKRLAPMFSHFRRFKLGAIHVKFVPSATLPVDPTGLSYEAGENLVDPIDMFNPGLLRHTNGEDVFIPDESVLKSEYADKLYYSTMLDRRWHKFHLQKGFLTKAFPKWYGVATTSQQVYPGMHLNVPGRTTVGGDKLDGKTLDLEIMKSSGTNFMASIHDGSSDLGLFQTGQKIPMGWMPTGASLKDEYGLLNGLSGTLVIDTKYAVYDTQEEKDVLTFDTREQANTAVDVLNKEVGSTTRYELQLRPTTANASGTDAGAMFAPIPEVPGLLTLCLPKARKTQFYYRVYVTEDVYFSDPVTTFNAIPTAEGVESYFQPIDVFTRAQISPNSPMTPSNPEVAMQFSGKTPKNDGA